MVDLLIRSAEQGLATADATDNTTLIDVIGNKSDASNTTSGQASIVGLLRYIVSNLNTDAEVAALLGELTTSAATGAVDNSTTVMGYLKQLVTGQIVIDGFNDVPSADSADNSQMRDVLGNKSDTVAGDSLVALVKQIVADTNELQTDWANGGRLDLLIDELTTQGDTNETKLDTIDTVVDETNSYLESGGDIYDVLYTDAAGASITADIATIDTVVDETNGYLEAGGDIHDVLYADAVGASLTADVASLLGYLESGGDIYDVLYTDAAGASITADIATIDGIVDTITAENSSDDSSGTFSYLDAGAEQDVVEITNSTRKIINAIWVDAINLTNNGTFKVYYKVDGTNYRELTDLAYTITAGTTEAVNLLGYAGNLGITEDLKVTYEEAGDEGAARDIPYSLIYETKE